MSSVRNFEAVITNFAHNKLDKSGKCEWYSHRSYSDNFRCARDMLWLNRYRPLAKCLKRGATREQSIFLRNVDIETRGSGWGHSDRNYVGCVERSCSRQCKEAGPAVSGKAFRAAGIEFEEFVLPPKKGTTETYHNRAEILDWTADDSIAYWEREDGLLLKDFHGPDTHWKHLISGTPFKLPKQGMALPVNHEYTPLEKLLAEYPEAAASAPKPTNIPEGKYRFRTWHTVGGALVRYVTWTRHNPTTGETLEVPARNKDRYLLCGVDERNYFVTELPSRAATVQSAFRLLKPHAVKIAEANGKRVVRQGEWFFIEQLALDGKALTVKDMQAAFEFSSMKKFAADSTSKSLPQRDTGSNRHVCQHLFIPDKKRMYASGKVWHKNSWGHMTHEHGTLELEGWWMAHESTQVWSWSGMGQVD